MTSHLFHDGPSNIVSNKNDGPLSTFLGPAALVPMHSFQEPLMFQQPTKGSAMQTSPAAFLLSARLFTSRDASFLMPSRVWMPPSAHVVLYLYAIRRRVEVEDTWLSSQERVDDDGSLHGFSWVPYRPWTATMLLRRICQSIHTFERVRTGRCTYSTFVVEGSVKSTSPNSSAGQEKGAILTLDSTSFLRWCRQI